MEILLLKQDVQDISGHHAERCRGEGRM